MSPIVWRAIADVVDSHLLDQAKVLAPAAVVLRHFHAIAPQPAPTFVGYDWIAVLNARAKHERLGLHAV